MSVHEQRESESTHADRLDEAQGTNRAKVGNEQSNYQAVAGETIFLLRFLPPPCPRLVKLLVHIHGLFPLATPLSSQSMLAYRMRITVLPENWKIRLH